jgi:hypothetical protein
MACVTQTSPATKTYTLSDPRLAHDWDLGSNGGLVLGARGGLGHKMGALRGEVRNETPSILTYGFLWVRCRGEGTCSP